MFSLFRHLGLENALRQELLPFGAAFVVAETFYKFHSFSLECVAFLATWYVFSYLQESAMRRM